MGKSADQLLRNAVTLRKTGKVVTSASLARRMGVTRQRATKLLKELEQRGELRRDPGTAGGAKPVVWIKQLDGAAGAVAP